MPNETSNSQGILGGSSKSARSLTLYEFTQGIEVDCLLFRQEIRVQLAWARALMDAGFLSQVEWGKIESALAEIERSIAANRFEWRVEDEDIHMNIEREITCTHGNLGKKMHLGRSRNDLIATTLRLFVADEITGVISAVKTQIAALAQLARENIDLLMPGLTHLQHGQPIRFAHFVLSHATALKRDIQRLEQARTLALQSMPLGSAALAGGTLPLHYEKLAQDLGFAATSENSYDSVGDRDFILSALDALAQFGVHLSRFCEDVIYLSSTAVGLLKLHPDWSTGSSIMPNKRNPDVPELSRAKSSHLMSAAAHAHTLLKSVGTSYGSDLHELKSVMIYAFTEARKVLRVLPSFTENLATDPRRAEQLLNQGHLLATEIADELARGGMPFRDAYARVAALVKLADSRGLQIHALPAADWQSVAPELTLEFWKTLTPLNAVEKRVGPGGTARARVESALKTIFT